MENLLYIYSLETFVYSQLNISSRNQDASKIETLGPLSFALMIIVARAEGNRKIDRWSLPIDDGTLKDHSTAITLYRGLKLTKEEIDEYKSYLYVPGVKHE